VKQNAIRAKHAKHGNHIRLICLFLGVLGAKFLFILLWALGNSIEAIAFKL